MSDKIIPVWQEMLGVKNKNYNDKVIQGYVNIFPAKFSYYDLEFSGIDTTYDGTKHYVDIVNKEWYNENIMLQFA